MCSCAVRTRLRWQHAAKSTQHRIAQQTAPAAMYHARRLYSTAPYSSVVASGAAAMSRVPSLAPAPAGCHSVETSVEGACNTMTENTALYAPGGHSYSCMEVKQGGTASITPIHYASRGAAVYDCVQSSPHVCQEHHGSRVCVAVCICNIHGQVGAMPKI